MYAIPFDVKKMEISGKPGLIQEGFRMEDGGESHYGFDQNGNLIYVPGISASICKLVWVNQNGKEDTIAFPPDNYGVVSISPDGKKIAYTQTGDNGEDLWIKSLKNPNQPAKPLIQTKASEWALRFSPNSQFIAYTSNTSGPYEVYVQGFPNADNIIQVSNGGGEEPVWTHSGRQVIYRNGNKWWMVDVITTDGKIKPATPRLLFEGPYLNCRGPSFDIAPDG